MRSSRGMGALLPPKVPQGFASGGAGNWIKGAVRKPGALRKALGVKEGETIPAEKLDAAAKQSGVMGQRARLAKTLKSFKK